MPGIVGLITKMPREQAEHNLQCMLETIVHESFYTFGTWVDESLGVYVGWTARKGSFSDGMPVRNEHGDIILIFCGEEFPEPETRRALKERGHVLEDKRCSYIAHLYEEDASFPSCLNGRFHGLVVDRPRRTATLFNDRYGMQRVYYHESKQAFYFAAEAKAILAVCPELRTVDNQGLGEFVACGCVLENRTLFRGINLLPPASTWVSRDGSIQQRCSYFQEKDWENQSALDMESYYQELKEVFSRKIARYFNGQEQIGISLTGGLDTRMIMAWHRCPPESLPCYSFGGVFRDSQDVLVAARVAQACAQHHEVLTVGEEFLSRFVRYAERTVYLTDGCADVARSPDLYINERAREIAPVRMTGNYGGEVLRRVRAFKPVEPAAPVLCREFVSHLARANETYTELLQCHPLSFAVFRQAPWHHYGLLALEESQLSVRSPYLDNEFVRTVFRAPKSAITSNGPSLRLIADGNQALQRIRTDRGLVGDGGGLRAVFTRSLLEFTFKAEYAYDHGMPQWVAKIDHLFSPLHLERLFLGRHKFYHFRIWYRDVLSKYVREMLLDSRTLSRPYLERSGVESIVRDHLNGNRNYTREIHKVLTLELVHRLFVDSKG